MNQNRPGASRNYQQSRRNSKKQRRLSAKQRARILRERRTRRLRRQFFGLLIALGVLVALLIAILLNTHHSDPLTHNSLELATLEPSPTPTAEPTSSPTPEPTFTPEPSSTPEPTPTATAEPVLDAAAAYDPDAPFSYELAYAAAVLGVDTGEPVGFGYTNIDPAKRERWPEAQEGFMPMLTRANTSERIIAVTVDDCFQADNLRQIVQCALDNGAKLTIFPIGTNLEKQSVASAIRDAWQQGMEIENHTYSHAGTYHYDDAGMTDDIFRQSYLLSQALGVNYRQHFFRPKGGDERFDQRTHAYIQQRGFAAMALWTQSGSVDSMDSLLSNLAPGRIYLFHTTNNDLKKIKQFIPAAVQQGYRLVTLNEMFGLPNNETADLSTMPSEAPALERFRVLPMTLKATAYARAAAVVQERLIELGWMHGEATGVYGKTTAACIELFQKACGVSADDVAGADTQRHLFAADAPTATSQRIRELLPSLSEGAQSEIRDMLAEYP